MPGSLFPSQLGYSMPAEWEPHRATWLAWPHNLQTWPDQLARVKEIWARMVWALAQDEVVCLLVDDEREQREVASRLKGVRTAMERVSFYTIRTVDVWMRDYGPTFVTRAGSDLSLAFNDWVFNGWGGKYKSYEEDDSVTEKIAALLNVPVFAHEIVLEGGSIDVNGRGTCLTTEQCLLNPNRNPQLSQREIEGFVKRTLGVSHVIWLGEGIAGDDTDGHIDDIARFVGPTTVVCVREDDPKDENYAPLEENYERLQGSRDQDGNKLTLVSLPSPGCISYQGNRLPASYANFYIANGTVLVPTFNHANDGQALGILSELFPQRKILGIPCEPLVAGLGAIHCVTQQEPLAKIAGT